MKKKRKIKGWLIDIGLHSSDRRKIKVYLTKKRAMETGIQLLNGKKRITRCEIIY